MSARMTADLEAARSPFPVRMSPLLPFIRCIEYSLRYLPLAGRSNRVFVLPRRVGASCRLAAGDLPDPVNEEPSFAFVACEHHIRVAVLRVREDRHEAVRRRSDRVVDVDQLVNLSVDGEIRIDPDLGRSRSDRV